MFERFGEHELLIVDCTCFFGNILLVLGVGNLESLQYNFGNLLPGQSSGSHDIGHEIEFEV